MSELDYRKYLEKVDAAKGRLHTQIDMLGAVGRPDLAARARALMAETVPEWKSPGLFSRDRISQQLFEIWKRLHNESKALADAFDQVQREEVATARTRAEAAIRAGEEHATEGLRLLGVIGTAAITCPSCGTRHSGRRMLEKRGCPNCSSDLVFTESDAATSDPGVAVALKAAGAWVQNAGIQPAAAKARQLLVMAAGQEQAIHMRRMEADAAKAEAREQLREREERQQIASDLRDIKKRLR